MSLVVEDLYVGYPSSPIDIIRGVSLRAEEQKITAIIGPNGSGKSTILKALVGILKPKSGEVKYKERNITGFRPHVLASKIGITYIPQERSIFHDLTVYENMKANTWPFRKEKERIEKTIAEILEIFPALKEKRNARAGTLSGGQQRMLEFSRTLVQRSRMMLVDEPTAGLSPILSMEVYDAIGRLKEEGITMLLVDQNVRQAIRLADYMYMLNVGQIVEEGPKEEFEGKMKSLIQQWI